MPLRDDNDPLQIADKYFVEVQTEDEQYAVNLTFKEAPIIFSYMAEFHLQHTDGTVESESVFPQRFHDFKAVAHLPVTAFSCFERMFYSVDTNTNVTYFGAPSNDTTPVPLTPHAIDEARRLLALCAPLHSNLPTRQFTAEELPTQLALLNMTEAFVKSTLAAGEISLADLTAFARASISNGVWDNMMSATKVQLDRVNDVFMGWRGRYDLATWRKLRVVYIGGHMMRENNLFVQYFTKVLKTGQHTGRWLIYAEAAQTMEAGVRLLGAHMFDEVMGLAFFGSRGRMHEDLLADTAAEYLREMFPDGR